MPEMRNPQPLDPEPVARRGKAAHCLLAEDQSADLGPARTVVVSGISYPGSVLGYISGMKAPRSCAARGSWLDRPQLAHYLDPNRPYD